MVSHFNLSIFVYIIILQSVYLNLLLLKFNLNKNLLKEFRKKNV